MNRFSSMILVCLIMLVCGNARLQASITYFVSTTGSDDNDGLTEATAFRTVTQAWNMIPMGEELVESYVIYVGSGTYTPEELPNYWESRYGTNAAMISFIANDGEALVTIPSINMYDVRYILFRGFNIVMEDGLPFHCEKCDHVTLHSNVIRGDDPGGNVRETVKFNQSQYITLSQNDISGADDNAIDFVAVQYAHVIENRIHNAGDWCMYTKGGSAYITVSWNLIYDCGVGGFTAGQGTGFQFMTAPWLQYEAYAIWFTSNIVHDTFGAGVGVNGGYDVAITDNVFYRVGERSHIIEVVYGLRTCDGQPGDEGRERCAEYHDMGGWGNDLVDDGTTAVLIPNKNVVIFRNVLYNPAPFQSADQHFTIASAYDGLLLDNSNLESVVADENLIISNNVIWNGDESMPLGVEPDFEAGCTDDNPTCNAAQLRADNQINVIEPQLVESDEAPFDVIDRESLFTDPQTTPPPFPAWDVPVPLPDPEWFLYPVGQ